MVWTYSGDPTKSSLDSVRFKIADTDKDDPKLSDEEINAFLFSLKSETQVVLTCVRFLMTKYAGECDYKIGPEQVSASQRYKQYKELYSELSSLYTIKSTSPQDPQDGTPSFGVGFMDNGGV